MISKFIRLYGDVDYPMSERFTVEVGQDRGCPISISLNSPGGDLGPALAIYDTLKLFSDSQILAMGLCASSATLILQGAKVRSALPSTQFVVHSVYVKDLDGNAQDTEENQRMQQYLNGVVAEIMIGRMGEENFEEALEEKIFDVQAALELKMIDRIIK